MGPFQLMDALRKELKLAADQTITVAAKAVPDREDEWDAYMRTHELIPKSDDERSELLVLKAEQIKGALPVEVRLVLDKHKQRAEKMLDEWKREHGSAEWWDRVEAPAKKLIKEFVDENIKRYLGELDKVVISAASIFANSASTSSRYVLQVQKAGTRSEKCPTCMAARPEGSDLRTCMFCGAEIFTA